VNDREEEIKKQHDIQKALCEKEKEIEMKANKKKQESNERWLKLHNQRLKLLAKKKQDVEYSFDKSNDRSKRAKWGKNPDVVIPGSS